MLRIIVYMLILAALTRCSNSIEKSNPEIDHETLKDLGEFLTDKNKVYRRYDTSDETLILELPGVDRETFTVFGNSIYAKDKNHVYNSRNGIVAEADPKTFEALKIESDGRIVYGKDKDNYFFWDQILLDTIGLGEMLKHSR